MAFIRPSFIDNMGYHMGEVYGAITDQILINLARYFPYWTESTVPKSAFEYQAVMLAQMGQVNAETVQILRNGLKGGNAALKNILEQAIMESVKKSFPELLKGVQNGIFNPATIPVLAPNQMQAFQFYYQQAAQKLNLVNTVMLESTRQAYQNTVADIVTRVQASQVALDVGAGEVVTGVSSWNQAMVHSINRMKENGITGFIDHAGHRWSAEAYTSMDIRTTVANTARAAVWETNQSFGNDLYLVSFHNGARPLCYPWQNKVISANDNAGVTYDLDGNEIIVIRQSDTSYGEPAGLFGINCKHYPTPFIPGVSVIYGQPQDKEENERVYAESQQQRALERKIREEKRDLLMMKAQGNVPDEVIKAQRAKIRQTDDDIDAFCEKTGRARRQNREGVYTKREFPDPQTYDVTTFERTQKDEIDKFFSSGGAQQGYTFDALKPIEQITPVTPIQTPTPETQVVNNAPVQETPQSAFTPAKTIEEAETFARENFVDTDMWGSQGLTLKGISVESANIVSQRMSEFYSEFKVDKFSSLIAPAGNTKIGKQMADRNAHAAFNPINRAMILNRSSLKNPNVIVQSMLKEQELITDFINNPDKYAIIETKDKRLWGILTASRTSGRGSVPTTLAEVIDHEDGHALEKALKTVSNYDKVVEGFGTYAEKVSGYATSNFGEYVAESFCSWRKGETVTDPELIKAFTELRR